MGSTASLEPDSGVVLTCRMDFMRVGALMVSSVSWYVLQNQLEWGVLGWGRGVGQE